MKREGEGLGVLPPGVVDKARLYQARAEPWPVRRQGGVIHLDVETGDGPVRGLTGKHRAQVPHPGKASLNELVERGHAVAIVGVREDNLEVEEASRDVRIAILEAVM